MIKRTAGRIAPHLVLASGGLLAFAASGLLTVARGPIGVLVCAACLGGSWAQMHTALESWATEVRPESRGLVMSAFAASLFTGSAVGTWVGGLLLSGGSLVLLYSSATAIAALLSVVATFGRSRQHF